MDKILIKRYLRGKNRLFLKSTHTLALIGIVIGVTALLIVSSVMNGFEQDMTERVIGFRSDIIISSANRSPISDYQTLLEKIEQHPLVYAASPVIETELLIHKSDNVQAVKAYGINYTTHNRITELEEQIRIGRVEEEMFDEIGVIIGLDLSLALNATVGEYIQLTSPLSNTPTPLGLIPQMRRLRIVGLFVSGVPEYDRTSIYISLPNARFFSGLESGVTTIQVATEDTFKAAKTAVSLGSILGSEYQVQDWSKFDAGLFQAMKLEKFVMVTVLTLMLIVAGFNMAGNSIKTVVEKRKEIGILKAIGMSNKRICNFFLQVNLLVGLIGITIGLIISLTFITLQENYRLINIPVPGFPMQWLPVNIRTSDFIFVPLIVIIVTLLATYIPIRKIRKIEPIRVIRNLD